MKLIIDIPEEAYKTIMNTSFVRDVDLTFKQSAKDTEQTNAIFSLIDAMDNGTPIPDNATNGEVFGKIMDYMFMDDAYVTTDKNGYLHLRGVKDDWWDAPYQKGGKE